MMGGALGLAVLASLAATRTSRLVGSGHGHLEALNSGYHLAFLIGTAFALVAGLLGALLLRANPTTAPAEHGPAAQATAIGSPHHRDHEPRQPCEAKRRRSGWRSAERARWAMSSTVTGERRLYRGLAAPSHMRNDASATPRTDGSATAVRSCAKH
jgi:hypothetical protein